MKISRAITTVWDAFSDWNNTEIYRRGRLELRRIDVLLFIMGVVIAGYYWLFYGWQWAVMGTLMYVLVAMTAIWLL